MLFRKGMILAILTILGVGGVALAQPRDEFDELSARTPWKVITGVETREFKLKGGVVVKQERVKGETSTMMMDVSGHGAVRCALQTYVLFLSIHDACHVDDDKWRALLMSTVGRVGEFAERNAIQPVTKDEIVSWVERGVREVTSASPADIKEMCTEPKGFSDAYANLRQEGENKFVASVDDLLSVERPAVLNPCY